MSVWPKIYDDICEWKWNIFIDSLTLFSKTKGGGIEKKGKSPRGESKKERKEKRECYSFMVFVMQVEKKKKKMAFTLFGFQGRKEEKEMGPCIIISSLC